MQVEGCLAGFSLRSRPTLNLDSLVLLSGTDRSWSECCKDPSVGRA